MVETAVSAVRIASCSSELPGGTWYLWPTCAEGYLEHAAAALALHVHHLDADDEEDRVVPLVAAERLDRRCERQPDKRDNVWQRQRRYLGSGFAVAAVAAIRWRFR